ncbi:MAG TPA: response regulator [Polyangiales bacterium]|jgi:diguanylate cyclase (GGDEF)-like protein|nr:response regulator [Polyangiales bacterium]
MSALVLVADSDPFNLRLLSELCSSLGYDVMSAADGGAVLDALARQRPSLVLMDAGLPVMDGLNVLGILKADAGLCDVPVLLVTHEDDVYSRERALALGANHCLLKPFRPQEVQQRLREVIDANDPNAEPDRARREGSGRVIVDPLTQLGTVNQLLISLDYEFTRAVRYKHALSCVVVACQNGEQLTTQLGAAVAERVVVPMANTIKGGIRTVDHVFRSGELEFTILLPETQEEGAGIVVQRLKALLRELHDRSEAPQPQLTVAAATLSSRSVNDGEALYAAAKLAVG